LYPGEKKMFTSLLAALLLPPTADIRPPLPAQINVNASLGEGWTVQLGAPVFWSGSNALPTVGINFGRHFAIGKALGWSDWAERVGVGVGGHAFAPVSFQQLYLGASAGLSHYTPFEGWTLDYGLRYAPLVAVDFAANNTTGYNGLFANVGVHMQIVPNSWVTLGLQGGAYLAFTRPDAQPLWMVQPIVGVNTSF
jgi:hypothetical protein